VIVGHALTLSSPPFSALTRGGLDFIVISSMRIVFGFGRESAFLFIFLSGFFSPAAVIWSREELPSIMGTVRRRLLRLYPTLIISLLVTWTVDIIGSDVLKSELYVTNAFRYVLADHLGPAIFIGNLLSLEPTWCRTFGTNGAIWTLGYLIQFFVLSCIAKGLSKSAFAYLINIIWILIVLAATSGLEPALLFITWLCGSAYRLCRPQSLVGSVRIFIAISAICLILALSRLQSATVAAVLSPLAGVILINVLYNINMPVRQAIDINVRKLASAGYATYAVHMPILFLLFAFIKFNYTPAHASGIYTLLSSLIAVTVSLASGAALSRLIFYVQKSSNGTKKT
jgi:hypothetical protein